MEKTKSIPLVLVLALVICFSLVQIIQAKRPQPQPSGITKTPIWQITQDGTDMSVEWVDHSPNPRFAIYDPNGGSDPDILTTLEDDIVFDKETCLLWERSPNVSIVDGSMPGGFQEYASSLSLGGRRGWRAPGLEDLLSLMAISPGDDGLYLPAGHPFVNIQEGWYWSATIEQSSNFVLYLVDFSTGEMDIQSRNATNKYVWCVRGGRGQLIY